MIFGLPSARPKSEAPVDWSIIIISASFAWHESKGSPCLLQVAYLSRLCYPSRYLWVVDLVACLLENIRSVSRYNRTVIKSTVVYIVYCGVLTRCKLCEIKNALVSVRFVKASGMISDSLPNALSCIRKISGNVEGLCSTCSAELGLNIGPRCANYIQLKSPDDRPDKPFQPPS